MYGYTTRTRTPISGYLYLGVSLILHDSFTKTWEAEVQNEKVWHGKRRCPHNGKTVKMALSTWGRPLQTNFFRCAHGWTRKWTFGTSSSCLPSWCLGLFFPVVKYFGVIKNNFFCHCLCKLFFSDYIILQPLLLSIFLPSSVTSIGHIIHYGVRRS